MKETHFTVKGNHPTCKRIDHVAIGLDEMSRQMKELLTAGYEVAVEQQGSVPSSKSYVVKELEKLRRGHYYCEDCWHSCPKAEGGCCDESKGDECDCGADKHNAILDSVIKYVTDFPIETLLD